MDTLTNILLIASALSFLAAVLRVKVTVDLIALGLLFYVLSVLLPALD